MASDSLRLAGLATLASLSSSFLITSAFNNSDAQRAYDSVSERIERCLESDEGITAKSSYSCSADNIKSDLATAGRNRDFDRAVSRFDLLIGLGAAAGALALTRKRKDAEPKA